MAFLNSPDGGRIIIGVKEKKIDNKDPDSMPYELTGMEPEHLNTWTHDHLADFAKNYADPYVEFGFESVLVNDKQCLVVRIQEFDEIPVICKKNYASILRCGAIYTRPKGNKRESAEVQSSYHPKQSSASL